MAIDDVLGILFAANPRTTIEFTPPSLAATETSFDIPLDAAVAINHVYRNTISRDTREDGTKVVDHVVKEPVEITIEGLVTDHPVEILGGALSGNVSGLFGDIIGAEVRHVEAWRLLVSASETGALLDVVTTLGEYTDMVIESLTTDQNRDNAHALPFTMHLVKQVTVKAGEDTPLDNLVDILPGSADAASGPSRRGQRSAQTATTAQDNAFAAAAGLL